MSSKAGVLGPEQSATDRPRFQYKRSVAQSLVERGLAVWIDKWCIRRVARSSRALDVPGIPQDKGRPMI